LLYILESSLTNTFIKYYKIPNASAYQIQIRKSDRIIVYNNMMIKQNVIFTSSQIHVKTRFL